MSKFSTAKQFINQIFGGGPKVFPTITKVDPFVPKNKKEILARDLRRTRQKRKTSEVKLDNTVFRINQQKKRLEEMKTGPGSANPKRPGKMGGGFMGKRMGYKRGTGLTRKSNVQKIKETFGPKQKPQSRMTGKKKFPDMSGDGKITQKDILIAKGVIPKPKKKVI